MDLFSPGLEPLPEKPLLKPKRNIIDEAIDPTSRAAQYKKIVERYSQEAKRKRIGGSVSKKSEGETSLFEVSNPKKTLSISEDKPEHSAKASEVPKDVQATAGCSKDPQMDATPNADGKGDRKDELLKKAPKVNFDIDLIHWEDEKLETAVQVSSCPFDYFLYKIFPL